jgi:hypothetical protein
VVFKCSKWPHLIRGYQSVDVDLQV